MKQSTKYLLTTALLIIIVGAFGAGLWVGIGWKKEIKIKKVTSHKTVMKLDPKELSFTEAMGVIYSPLQIRQEIKDNTMYIRCYDDAKSVSREVELEVHSTNEWKFVIAGAVATLAAIGAYKIIKK